MELWDSAVRMVSSLVLVLGVILGLLALTRTVLGRRLLAPVGSPLIRVLGSSYIGPRKSVLVLAVAGEVLIIGTTATDVIPLGRLTDPEHIKQALSQSGPGLYVPQTVAKAVSGDL